MHYSDRLQHHLARLKWQIACANFESAARRFELMRRKANFNPDQPRDDNGRWTGGGGSSEATDFSSVRKERRAGGISEEDQKLPVKQFVARNCKGIVKGRMPGQFNESTIEEVMSLAKRGDSEARACLKLLQRREYRK